MSVPRHHTVDWAMRLISLDTTSRDPNLPLIDVVREELAEHGVTSHVRPGPQEGKANLIATIPAADGSTEGGVVLSGHTDVVPVDGQRWTSAPFTPQVREGRLYGRGSADMKGFLACVLSAVPDMQKASLREPIHLAFSYDEEVGCLGGDQIVKDLADLGLTPRVAIIGEPTMMRAVLGHKSVNLVEMEFHGHACHSSLKPHGLNAIEHAAVVIRRISELGGHFATEGPTDEAYEIAHTTIGVNTVRGGIASNTVADRCLIQADFRTIAAEDPRAVVETLRAFAEEESAVMRARHPSGRVDFTVVSMVPGLETSPQGAAADLIGRLGRPLAQEKVTYGTEAGQFSEAGIDAVVCGPGDIAQAHGTDEYVELAQLAMCEEMLDALVAELSG
ncbi:acetylornithine deacetylase [Austwickia chelonae]|uniref:Acetylornithine deacetylase n=1 Tax=Austwickia chelonae NBRC 105200 TaxID=1184607 RepID=K6VJ82_9MICO|nr:acetylornithine deacetylase [Austwickia chelonae]GAB76794.1 acetylornithine deacetylase [Austwickia chelonae NBRC 105200]SEW30807.1 acetylornithine deacetylase [Austwickia chelonae]